ncbi:DUF4334 domain-containing protein [Streptomyces sp. NPDC052496]|uniref:DUF4334 domain-containing protein n=1 Tax=Streptomyces sp. NPDC052496 TaxID=3154951 RepID=UPI003421C89B
MPRLEIWLKRLGLPMAPALVPLMCLQTAFFTPWLPPATCLLMSRLTAWLMAIDNVLDAPETAAPTAPDRPAAPDWPTARVQGWHRILDGHGADGDDPVARALAEIAGEVAGSGRPELVAVWRESMHQTLIGMRHEHEAARAAATGGAAPGLTDYLRHGAWSIGVEQQVTALWTLLDEPDLPRRLPVLRAALREAAIAVRLLNDLRGHRRERAEGKPDVLALGLTGHTAYERAAAGLDTCRRALAPLSRAGYGSAVALERVVLWHARMYHRFDPVRPGRAAAPPLPGSTTRTPPVPQPRKAPPMGIEQEVLDAVASGSTYDSTRLADLFDRLEPVDTAFLIGTWRGGAFEDAGENAALLAKMRWYGKRFVDADHVEPLLCRDEDGTVYSYTEMGLASLREVVHRGKQSAAMVYDQLPVIDHFRRLTDDVLLCVMDKKGDPEDFYFHLTRVPDSEVPAAGPESDRQ